MINIENLKNNYKYCEENQDIIGFAKNGFVVTIYKESKYINIDYPYHVQIFIDKNSPESENSYWELVNTYKKTIESADNTVYEFFQEMDKIFLKHYSKS